MGVLASTDLMTVVVAPVLLCLVGLVPVIGVAVLTWLSGRIRSRCCFVALNLAMWTTALVWVVVCVTFGLVFASMAFNGEDVTGNSIAPDAAGGSALLMATLALLAVAVGAAWWSIRSAVATRRNAAGGGVP